MSTFQKVSNNMNSKKMIIVAVFLTMCLLGYIAVGNTDRGNIEHDHIEQSTIPNEHEGDDEHSEEGQAIELIPEEIQEIGLETAVAGPGVVEIHISLPGEIKFNANKLAHIVPTLPGIVRQVVKDVGDTVVAGEIIAWLESTKLGGAKVDYMAKHSEISCCSIEFIRAQEIHDNTLKLLEILNNSPSLETLQSMNDGEMGMNRSKLVSAYAELIFSRESYLREKGLYESKVSSQDDFLKAQRAFNKADAEYTAMRDSISFEVKRDLLEARRSQQIREIELQTAERLLYLHGLTAEDVEELSALAQNRNLQTEEKDCNDPNCTECAAESATEGRNNGVTAFGFTNEKLAWYPIRSPFEGTIIEKHIVLGEMVGQESLVFVIADLSSVWIDLQVYPKDLKHITTGQEVVISADSEIPDTSGIISYVGPVVGAESRTASARVVLENKSGILRPGLFVNAKVSASKKHAKVVIPQGAIQSLEGRKCVFVKDEHGFEPALIEIGLENTDHAEILSGLTAGQEYVIEGAFALKSKIVTSTLDSHAGHGH